MPSNLTPTEVFKCLADDTRVKMALLINREKELCVCELTFALDQGQSKISRHLALLRNCGLLSDRRQGQWVYYRLHPDLPQWVNDVLSVTGKSNEEWLEEQSCRLSQMGYRPARLTNKC
ncbi:MAG: metalloregulator ArsR/SmtB family transcription factor [Methylophaga sp.]|uniref:metalloregulator ArsR/SmtB family transcription factor n=1 Tax=Methylophaga sp. TaxID=2024840 RepID=UPI00299D6508|nr:metalloregulator ArsR/SmtB family transcription factor [Methylophaga sp.]MDX1751202.1 metalloregulator ArsR/SmtB family transcription factor [Methylophaga sp.]